LNPMYNRFPRCPNVPLCQDRSRFPDVGPTRVLKSLMDWQVVSGELSTPASFSTVPSLPSPVPWAFVATALRLVTEKHNS